MTNCVCCDQEIKDNDELGNNYYEYSTMTYLGDPIHETCLNDDESEPTARVKPLNSYTWDLFDEYNGYDLNSLSIGSYHNQTDKIFECGHVGGSPNSWRGGYYQPTSEKFKEVWENHATMGYGNEELLKKFDQVFSAFCEANKIRACRILSRTSNCCSQGLGYWVYNEDLAKFEQLQTTELKELLAQ